MHLQYSLMVTQGSFVKGYYKEKIMDGRARQQDQEKLAYM